MFTHVLCELHLHWLRDKLLYVIMYNAPSNMLQIVYQEVHSNIVFHKQIHI